MSTSTPSRTKKPLGELTMVIAFVAAIAIGVVVWMRGATPPVGDPIGGLAVGKTAPPITAPKWINDEAPDQEKSAGRVTVVHGWFNACPHCWKEASYVVKIQKKYADRGVAFVGLTPDGEGLLPQIARFLDKNGITWPNGYEARETLIAFEATRFPCLWVIGRDGKVVWNRASTETLEAGIEAALAGSAE